MCPAGIQPRHGARGLCKTADPLRLAPLGQDLSTTGKVQVQGAHAAWLCWHPSPQHSSASAALQTEKPQEPSGTLAPSMPLPSKLQHHTTACHLCPLRGVLPAPCQTPQPHPPPPTSLWDQPAPLRGSQPAHAGHGAPYVLPSPRGMGVPGTPGGRQDTWEGAVREGWSLETSRDQPCSAPKLWEYG